MNEPDQAFRFRPPTRRWEPAEDASLSELWLANQLSASAIGERIGRTRNAVIGRAARIGLPLRVPPTVIRSARSALPPRPPPLNHDRDPVPLLRRIKMRRGFDLVQRPKERKPPTPETAPPEPWPGPAVPFLEAEAYQCRAIVSNPDEPAACCGARIPVGQPFSFCPYHLGLYTTPRWRRTPSERFTNKVVIFSSARQ
jgi:GcrA cell cycle regulator